MDILIATSNPGKLREYGALLAEIPARLLSVTEVGLGELDVEEPYDTYEANARHKAEVYARHSGLLSLADDSGLSVDALGGRPGVYSARYAPTEAERNQKLLGELAIVPDGQRTARFICVIAVADPRTGELETGYGAVEGRIAYAPGEVVYGFGYDPIFIPDGYDKVFSALGKDEKNALSHRGRAAQAILPALRRLVGMEQS